MCLVTGATSGLGAVVARELHRRGATVVVAGRDAGRCAAQVARMRRVRSGVDAAALVADLSSQAGVRALAEGFLRRHARLDVLVNDAGAYFLRREVTADGIERTLALNHLAPFMLTLLLLDRLRASPAARVVNVSSIAHARWGLELDDLQGERCYRGLQAYGRAKLANVLFTFELARRLEGTPITVNAVHPGMVATNLGANNGWLRAKLRNAKNRLKHTMVTPEEGAKVILRLASAPELEGVTGRYHDPFGEARPAPLAQHAAAAAALWRRSEALTGVRWEDVAGALPEPSTAG